MELTFNRKIECTKDVIMNGTGVVVFNRGIVYRANIANDVNAINNLNTIHLLGSADGDFFKEHFRVVTGNLLEGRVYLCSDGRVRRLNKVERNIIHYSEPIDIIKNKPLWSNDITVVREASEGYFVNGNLLPEDNIILVYNVVRQLQRKG